MTEYPLIRKRIDIGWNYSSVQFAKIVMIPDLQPNKPFPPENLLQLDESKGKFGFMNTKCEEYNEYEKEVLNLIDPVIEDNTIIIMSEFGFTKQLEEKVSQKLINKKGKCIIVGGSYYFKNKNNKIESRCPIILPNRQIEYQLKFLPSPKEKDKGFDPPDLKEIIIFQNSGFGDFAILVCFDALNDDLINRIKNHLRSSIDYLIIIYNCV